MGRKTMRHPRLATTAVVTAATVLGGCGGGGGSISSLVRSEVPEQTAYGNAVKAHTAYGRIFSRFPGEAPGQGVKVTVIDTGIDQEHWEFDRSRTSEDRMYDPDAGDESGDEFSHGTAVASVIAAQLDPTGVPASPRVRAFDFYGIAWGVRLHMIGITLGTTDPFLPYTPVTTSQLAGENADAETLAARALTSQGGPDIINMSFGYEGLVESYTESELRESLGQTIATLAQGTRDAGDRALLVWAAGNSNGRLCTPSTPGVGSLCVGNRLRANSPSVQAGAMAHIPELRGHSVAVVATDSEGRIADFSNRCGIAAKWCLAAPGTDMLVASWGPNGRGYRTGLHGTSFAAPVVTGGLAVVKHYFRGQMANHEVLARVLDTADVTPDPVSVGGQCPLHLDTDGDRNACELSSELGRGLMNLDKATRPVGSLSTGSGDRTASIEGTRFRGSPAWGDLRRRLGNVEIASFDDRNAPFWTRLGDMVSLGSDEGTVIPSFGEGAEEAPVAWQGLQWADSLRAALPWSEGSAEVRYAFAADTSGQVTSSGLSLGGKDGGWRAGAVLEHGAVAGGGAGAGAFDDGSRHVLTFANYAKRMRLGDAADAGKGWSVAVSTTLAGGLMRSDGILQEAKGLYSQHHVALAHAGDRHRTQLRIEQPLRAESGRANFKRPVGRTVAGGWIYDTARIGLRPEARAVRIGAQHERELGTGKIAFGASYTADAGHRPGEDDAAIGARYELRW